MHRMHWAQFLDAHFRPHLVAVNLGTISSSPSGRHLVATLQRLAESLGTNGNYSMRTNGRVVNVAFEKDIDALRFVEALGAQETERPPDWASRWTCSFDRDGRLEVLVALKRLRLRVAGRRGGPKGFRGPRQVTG
jgi:hypothetical protein